MIDAAAARALRDRAGAVLAQAAPVPSPCTSVCRMDPARGLCDGCLRTLDEITAWSRLPDAGRRAVWMQLAQRAETLA